MIRLASLAATEARLLARDWTVLVFAFVFPPFVMLILAGVFGSEPDDGYAVAEALGLVHVVGDENHGHALVARLLDQPPGLPAGDRVESLRELVEEYEPRTIDEGEGEKESLPLAAGQGPERLPQQWLEAPGLGEHAPVEDVARGPCEQS